MHIALVHSFYASDSPSGENVVVEMQRNALMAAGHHVSLISRETDVLARKPLYQARTAARLVTGLGRSPLGYIPDTRPDVIHVHNLFPNWSTQWLSNSTIPIVTTLHNFRPICPAATLFRDGQACHLCVDHDKRYSVIHSCYRNSRLKTLPLAIATRKPPDRQPLLATSRRLVVLSDRAKREYVRAGIDNGKIDVVPNFAPPISISDHAPNRIDTRRWVYIGRLTQEKGIAELVEAWPGQENLTIIGDGPLLQQLNTRAPHNIRVIGRVEQHETRSAISAATGLIIPSRWPEGLPTVLLEAMAAGTPVIALLGNGAADMVREAKAGIVIPNLTSLHNALDQVANNRQWFANNGQRYATNQLSIKQWQASIQGVYNSAISESQP